MALPIVADVEQSLGFWPAREPTAITWLCGSMQEYGYRRLSERDGPAYSDSVSPSFVHRFWSVRLPVTTHLLIARSRFLPFLTYAVDLIEWVSGNLIVAVFCC